MSFTPRRRLGFSSLPPSPANYPTPRSDRRLADLRWAEGGTTSNCSQDREVNVQVVVRCRPLAEEEQQLNAQQVVHCNEQNREVTVLQNATCRQDRTFVFDKVFGPRSQQRSIYDQVISPVVNDVLEGYNCTVFAYGQTGTGKTYTMEGAQGGAKPYKVAELSADAGVIPRAVRQIFDTLDAQRADYSMKVTFLELYNEEITDLLAPEESCRYPDDKQRKLISLMEDGKGGAVIRGLEEEVVYSVSDICRLLDRTSAKRKFADTFMNKQSSRSHSLFSITVHVKETTAIGQELIKCGRLNLVDLAGSENVSRSGAREGRAREAGELNKSLLTLGRVITALVEHSAHVPYRDSKLTRLLRDALGGKAKTCIIATVSPSSHCLEETLCTLDYAMRAKNIRNKPEVNQKLSKSVFLKDLYTELERMKQDVKAARDRNGVYIPPERYAQDQADMKAMEENIERLETDLDLTRKETVFMQKLYKSEQELNLDLKAEIQTYKKDLESLNEEYLHLKETHRMTNSILKEKENIISHLVHSETAILARTKELHSSLETASENMIKLHSKIDQKTNIETKNKNLVTTFGYEIDQSLKKLNHSVISSVSQQSHLMRSMQEQASCFLTRKFEEARILESKMEKMKDRYSEGVAAIMELVSVLEGNLPLNLEEIKSRSAALAMTIENFLVTLASEAEQNLHDIQNSLIHQKELLSFSARQQEMGLQRTLVSTQMISKTTLDFFQELKSKASKLISALEKDEVERTLQIETFWKKFEETSAEEEEAALQKISGILSCLNKQKANLICETIKTISSTSNDKKEILEVELCGMQDVSSLAQNEWHNYIDKIERQFQEDTFSAAETRDTIEKIMNNCSEKVCDSVHHWANAQLSVDELTRNQLAEMNAVVETRNQETCDLFTKLGSLSSETDEAVASGMDDLMRCSKKSLTMDKEGKKEVNRMFEASLNNIQLLQDYHSDTVSEILNQADSSLIKEYLVDDPTNRSGGTPRRAPIEVPCFKSIEALKTPLEELLRTNNNGLEQENPTSEEELESLQQWQPKLQQQRHSLPKTPPRTRSPLSTMN